MYLHVSQNSNFISDILSGQWRSSRDAALDERRANITLIDLI
jgi:hypothetical protein